MTTTASLTDARRATLHRRIKFIVAFTISYNVIEAVVAIWTNSATSSATLINFSLDSVVEVLSAAAVAWQFTRKDPERWEKPTLRVIAVAFFALAAYVIASAGLTFAGVMEPEHSTVGLVLAGISILIMPAASLFERATGKELGSATAIADSKQTMLCALLSVAVLAGLGLNSLFGWAWADSVAALFIAGFAIREGIEAWKGDACATSVGMILEGDDHDDHDHDHDHEHEER
jgi:divalent metal cation (Fe/Co/Zn/Cd) transporter